MRKQIMENSSNTTIVSLWHWKIYSHWIVQIICNCLSEHCVPPYGEASSFEHQTEPYTRPLPVRAWASEFRSLEDVWAVCWTTERCRSSVSWGVVMKFCCRPHLLAPIFADTFNAQCSDFCINCVTLGKLLNLSVPQ